MALSQKLQWQRIGSLNQTPKLSISFPFSSFVSSLKMSRMSTQSKRAEAAKERAAAVESFVKEYMQTHPGVFPKALQVQKKLGGSWYLLKDILEELKGKMLRNPQVQMQRASEKTDLEVNSETSDARDVGESVDTTNLGKHKKDLQSSEGLLDVLSHEKDISTASTHYTVEKSSGELTTSSGDMVKPEEASNCVKLAELAELGSRDHQFEEVNPVLALPDHKLESKMASVLIQGVESVRQRETRSSTVAGSSEATSFKNGNHSSSKKAASYQALNAFGRSASTPSSPYRAEQVPKLADMFRKRTDVKLEDANSLVHGISSGVSKESSRDACGSDDIMSLIDRIKEIQLDRLQTRSHDHMMSNKAKAKQLNNHGLPIDTPKSFPHKALHQREKMVIEPYKHNKEGTRIRKETGTCNGDKIGEDKSEKGEEFSSELMKEGVGRSSFNDTSSDHVMPKDSLHVLQYKMAPQKKDPTPFLLTAKGRTETNVLLRFLPTSTNEKDIRGAFVDCGPITEVRFTPSKKGSKFVDAYIYFQTRESMQKALAKADITVSNADVIVASASPLRTLPNRIVVPNLIINREVPAALIVNPTRTIMLKGFPQELASHHLREAFSFCGGHISGFIMGSSSSVAYIEFETEDAKEKAIAASSVSISGKHLSVLRIDTPRTTVVRLHNLKCKGKREYILNLCSLYGKVKRMTSRAPDVVDVYFEVSEWPKMVNILNSLNGAVINGTQLIALPAPVIPAPILDTLWSQPDGREHVCSLIRNLSRKLRENHTSRIDELCTLADRYYGTECSTVSRTKFLNESNV